MLKVSAIIKGKKLMDYVIPRKKFISTPCTILTIANVDQINLGFERVRLEETAGMAGCRKERRA